MPTPTIVPIGMDLLTANRLDAIEATDAEIGRTAESVDVGPLPDGSYLRLCAADLVVTIDAARRLLDRMEDVILEARADNDQARSHVCPGCRTMLPPDLATCGAPRCDRELALDCGGL